MRRLLRTVLLFGCCEVVPLTRRTFGFGFCLWLALLFAVKHQVLIYVPVSGYYQVLNEYAALAMLFHLVGRFVSIRMLMRHAGLPLGYPGTPWLRFFGLSDKAAPYYGEPLLVLIFAWYAMQTPVYLHFRPLFRFDFMPLPYGVAGSPFPLWYRRYGIVFAYLLPVISALCLAFLNRLAVRKPSKQAPSQEKPLTFTDVQPSAPAAALPVPSAAGLARALHHERNTP